MKTIGRDFGDTARKVYAVASGALGNGKAAVVNSDGTVSVAAESSFSVAFGSEVSFEDAVISTGSTFDSNSNRVVIAYSDSNNSDLGTAVVGSVDPSDNSISFGTPVVFGSGGSSFLEASSGGISFDSNSNRVVICYKDNGNSAYGTARVGSVDPSDNSISFGTAEVYEAASSSNNASTFDSTSNRIVIAYQDSGNSGHGTSIVGSVDPSDNSITFGTAVVHEAASSEQHSIVFDVNANRVVVSYDDHGNSTHGTAIVGAVDPSNNSIAFGTAEVFHAAASVGFKSVYDSSANKVVLAYEVAGDGYAIVGTVDPSDNSISFGTAAAYDTNNTTQTSCAFDSNVNKVVFAYRGLIGGAAKGAQVIGTVSGTSISFTSPAVWHDADTQFTASTFDSNSNKVVFSYRDNADSGKGKAVVFQSSGTSTNLTSENFIGITPSAYPDGAGAEIQTKGAVNEEQSGLTAGQSYYVQTDGTLSTTAGDPSVLAGTAVSATKIIVKG